ncbi:hypothetical protein METBIDRAFT_42425 [Metschnikowia bicuspidata var. bicuspidata NRRL YB-4993]|uniref:Uncharacterized protein n=1 Tax=Metschnikowia bicuspidata var. bicuspidata NRRL YB-4993 TaxID=869754 RepID=A0A1A0HA12_9ASCO|nr:hypothetical protein METBIDRAFT_42425 [Metschnikowia bicuspidata var. bicuspidata NRRL YB-4993]OBA20969.1 hypothetical protein METBIDRAFT_42425 [Metschnikowia bicuspidata var. bicuspidata NRRL YB-4993]
MQRVETPFVPGNPPIEGLPPYKDDIPAYTPSLQFYGIALLKMEFDTPWSDRSTLLKPVVVELNSNQLNMYEFAADKTTVGVVGSLFKHQNYADASQEPPAADYTELYFFDCDAYGDSSAPEAPKPMFSKLRNCLDKKKTQRVLSASLSPGMCLNKLLLEPTSDRAVYDQFAAIYRGKLIHSYTLAHLNVGEAPCLTLARYKEEKRHSANAMTLVNYRNTLRLRIEYTQLLLHFWSFHGMVHWFRNMSVGRDLASSIDDRKLTVLKSVPRNFSVANNALLEASAREALTFNPDTCKMVHRDSISSAEDRASCFSEYTMGSGESGASSVASACSESCKNLTVDIYGAKLTCFENMYTPIEKQYISKCIPVLNSFDKWMGAKITISNYEHFVPRLTRDNCNENENVFISHYKFSDLVKTYNRNPAATSGPRRCRDFYVDSAGLVSI